MKNKNVTKCEIESNVWLEYLEGELDSSLQKDLGLHVKSCKKCRRNLAEFRTIRVGVKGPEVQLPSDEVFAKMTGKIMNAISGSVQEKPTPLWRDQFILSTLGTAAVAVFVLVSVLTSFRNHFVHKSSGLLRHEANIEDQLIAQNSAGDPGVFGDVIFSHQDSDDLVLDAAADKLSRMSDKDARMVLEKMK